MKTIRSLFSLVVVLASATLGCSQGTVQQKPATGDGGKPAETLVAAKDSPATDVVLCGKCGQFKGTEACCIADASTCDKCGLAKGSPGCCKIAKGEDVTLCPKCGQIKGSETCCDPNAAVCEKCGLAKGSIGCCKIKS